MYTEHFSQFRAAAGETIHLAAHSHHWWPDVSRAAQLQAWDDAAQLSDHKWNKIFSDVYPKAQQHVAAHFPGVSADRVCFAPNTHELVVRLVTALWQRGGEPLHVVTSDSEFHSAARQFQRWQEGGWINLTVVAGEPWPQFAARFLAAVRQAKPGLVFLSQVFFNSGLCCDDTLLRAVAALCRERGHHLVIDGYHAFSAIPFVPTEILDDAFYLAGGYKYAASGEGCCFLVAPKQQLPRPLHTGWFASYGALSAAQAGQTEYAADARRFLGATFDVSPLYRLNAVFDLWNEIGSSVADRHRYVMQLKQQFFAELTARKDQLLPVDSVITAASKLTESHFLTLRLPQAMAFAEELAQHDIIVDARADRLRFGFGVYQTEQDLARFWARFTAIRADLASALGCRG